MEMIAGAHVAAKIWPVLPGAAKSDQARLTLRPERTRPQSAVRMYMAAKNGRQQMMKAMTSST